jgi:hypothetical protein
MSPIPNTLTFEHLTLQLTTLPRYLHREIFVTLLITCRVVSFTIANIAITCWTRLECICAIIAWSSAPVLDTEFCGVREFGRAASTFLCANSMKYHKKQVYFFQFLLKNCLSFF